MIEAVERVLAERAGLNTGTIGRSGLQRALAARMTARGVSEPADYLKVLLGSTHEVESLVEDVTVRETWFFRDRGPFQWLEQFAREQPELRVLSAPCATGEEAYSIAITLLEAGLPPDRFHVDACDISECALEAAARAVYGAGSFREDWRDHRNRWFDPVPQGFALRREVVPLVQFHRDDLLHPVFVCVQPPYDVVFCRNLLIYLLPEAQRTVIARLGALLRDGGIVVTGHAEVAALLAQGYEAVSPPGSFACRKRAPVDRSVIPTAAAPPVAEAQPAEQPRPDRLPLLQSARRLADAGAYTSALSLCEEVLAEKPDAEAYHLEGLIHSARNRLSAAEECFRRALYLNPAHYESLVQMSLLCERLGEFARGRLFRERAARLAGASSGGIDARRR